MGINQIKGKTILVTGGAGLVGSYLCEALLALEAGEIRIVDNLTRGKLSNLSSIISDPRVKFCQGDIMDSAQIDKLVSGTDYVYHLAALRINQCAKEPELAFKIMAEASFNLINTCNKYKVRKLIFSSTASVYGFADTFPTPETANPYDNQTFYGAAKLFTEQMLRSNFFQNGLDFVALRYFNIYGPRMDIDGKYTEVMIKWLDCIRDQRSPLLFGDGSTTLDCVYVTDVVKANIQALIQPISNEVFNIGSGEEVSLKQLLQMLMEVNNSNLEAEIRPENTINPVSRRLADISKSEKLLDFEPKVKLREGLSELSKWYFHQKNAANKAE